MVNFTVWSAQVGAPAQACCACTGWDTYTVLLTPIFCTNHFKAFKITGCVSTSKIRL